MALKFMWSSLAPNENRVDEGLLEEANSTQISMEKDKDGRMKLDILGFSTIIKVAC
jgi:hypothetical protein